MECRPIARANQRSVYAAFFRASAQTFLDLAAQPRHLHGLCGPMGVLQTWRRDLAYHPHIHYLVPGGALADGHSTWRPHRYDGWLLPETALAAAFKQRFQRELQGLGLLDQLDSAVWTRDKKWVVDAMPAGTGETVLQYLAPYVHRVAIPNPRILACRDGQVTFRFKARDHGQWRHMTLPVDRFIARFLQHVLPRGFVKVRYYGFLAAKARHDLLPVIRQLLPEPPHSAPATAAPQAGPPPPQEPLHDHPPDPALEPASEHGSCRQWHRTIPAHPDAGALSPGRSARAENVPMTTGQQRTSGGRIGASSSPDEGLGLAPLSRPPARTRVRPWIRQQSRDALHPPS
ncbi:MAG: transposase [Candidatus Latescibacterota bacterium]